MIKVGPIIVMAIITPFLLTSTLSTLLCTQWVELTWRCTGTMVYYSMGEDCHVDVVNMYMY